MSMRIIMTGLGFAAVAACAVSTTGYRDGDDIKGRPPIAGSEGDGDPSAGSGEGDGDGCTLTQGYWKNHDWPADYADATLCDQTWMDILWTPPKGDAWYILAHQWIAATLNGASGADAGDEITQALSDAADLVDDCSISDADRAAAIALAGMLDDYNNGLTGPGHCDGDDDGGEDGDSGCDDKGSEGGGAETGGAATDGGGTDGGGTAASAEGGGDGSVPEP